MLDEVGTTEPERASPGVRRERPNERRDIQRALNLWQKHVSEDGGPPILATFDFSPMRGDWGHRFLICSEPSANSGLQRIRVCSARGVGGQRVCCSSPSLADPASAQTSNRK